MGKKLDKWGYLWYGDRGICLIGLFGIGVFGENDYES
jgi:hypothetical protein